MSIIMGIDLSLTGTGLVILDGGKTVVNKIIKSKPPEEKTHTTEIERLLKIKAEIQKHISKYSPDLALIEGLAFGARNTTALMQLAGLSYMVRETFVLRSIPFIVVAPTTLKKFIVGKGNATKDLMLLETFKRYGQSFLDNNICDAFALAQCGAAVKNQSPIKLSKPQQEVISLLKKQYV